MSGKRRKYGNRKVRRFGMLFDSKLEADRYMFLRSSQDAGKISELRTQVTYELVPKFRDNQGKTVRAIKYILDFEYYKNDQVIVEDAKGYQTDVNKIKVKLFKREYPYHIFRLVKKPTEQI